MNKRLLTSVVVMPLVVAAFLVSSSACGTMKNFSGNRDESPPLPYGGVAAVVTTPDWKNVDEWKSGTVVFGGPFLLLDFGLSAILDTATLPIVLLMDIEYLVKRWVPSTPRPTNTTENRTAEAELQGPQGPTKPTPAETLFVGPREVPQSK